MLNGLRSAALVRYLPSVIGLPVGGMIGVALVLVLPGGSAGAVAGALFGGGGLGAVAGYTAGTHWYVRRWVAVGRVAGLSPESGGGLVPSVPDLTGSVRGRRVRVSYRSGEQGDRTRVEASLDRPATEGLVVRRVDGDGDAPRFGDDSVYGRVDRSDAGAVVRVGSFVAVGPSETVAQAVVSGAAREALSRAPELDAIRVGDPSGLFETAVADQFDGTARLGAQMAFDVLLSGDPGVASGRGDGTLPAGGAEIRRQIDAIVGVAEIFETARDGR